MIRSAVNQRDEILNSSSIRKEAEKQVLEMQRTTHLKLESILNEAHENSRTIHNQAIKYKNNTQQQCESLIQHSKVEASMIRDGANQYADKILKELENKIRDINNTIAAGRKELKTTSIQSHKRNK